MIFFRFLMSGSALTIVVTFSCVRVFWETYLALQIEKPGDDEVRESVDRIVHEPTVIVMAFFTLLCAWSLTSLTCFHGMIISINQTTNEKVRGVYDSLGNPANQGCLQNWAGAICREVPESRIPKDFSENVDCRRARKSRDGDDGVRETVYDSAQAQEKVNASVENGIVYQA